MMNHYRYALEHGSKKYYCPNCNKKKFVLYIDNSTNDYINEKVGRCDREIECGFHYSPNQFFNDFGIQVEYKPISEIDETVIEPDFIPNDIFQQSLNGTFATSFAYFCRNRFGTKKTIEAFNKYKLGYSSRIKDGIVFWQIDKDGNVRSGKIMQYDVVLGKRTGIITWAHSTVKENYNLKQCLFGEHLIHEGKQIALVESEKTAVIASMFMSDFTWMATSGLHGLKNARVLKGLDVTAFPDAGCYDNWKKLSNEFQFKMSHIMENRTRGSDIADLLTIKPIIANDKLKLK